MNLEQRRAWNENHKYLTEIIGKPAEHERATELFLRQHVWLYSSKKENSEHTTYEDELLVDLKEETFRAYPVHTPDSKNSIVWHLWHSARIEDMTMNVLAADTNQVLHADNWLERMNVNICHSGNEMDEVEIALLSAKLDIEALLAYRAAVGRRTREIIRAMQPGQLKQKVDASRLERLVKERAVKEEAGWLLDYWGKKTSPV